MWSIAHMAKSRSFGSLKSMIFVGKYKWLHGKFRNFAVLNCGMKKKMLQLLDGKGRNYFL